LLGLAVDYLFYNKPLGLSFPVFIGLCIVALIVQAILEQVRPSVTSLWLALPMLGLAYMVFVRAEPLTTFVNVSVTLALGILWARTFAKGRLFQFGLLDVALNYVLAGVETFLRPWPVLADSGKQAANSEGRRRLLLPIARGLILAAPILCVFTFLLTSADLIFADRFQELLEALRLDNIPELFARVILIGLTAFLAIGLLAQALRPRLYSLIGAERDLLPRVIGLIESGIVLGGLNLLFATFVAIQFRYLFGGVENIVETGYTYSEYARRGFGELTLVVFFSLLILLALSAIVRRDSRQTILAFNVLNFIMVALVGVIVVSALQRLLLYEEIYGFTRLRTYSHVAIIWLGALFIPYLIALLAGRLRWFAPGTLFVVIGFAATLNGLNVDAFIAQQNIDRLGRGNELHTRYLITLSDEVIPELVALFQRQDSNVNSVLGPGLACRAQQTAIDYAQAGWQSTHQSHQAAYEALNNLPGLTRYLIIHHPYGDFVYVGDERITCRELTEGFVLEPGLTSEYRDGR
jgi:hypothetical protein